MLSHKKIYRLSLALKNREKRTDVDLKDFIEDLAGAKDEFNAQNDQNHRMLLLEPTRKRVNLLFKPGQDRHFQPEMLQLYNDILKEGFDWYHYCNRSEPLFDVKLIRPVQKNEYQNLLEELRDHRSYRGLGEVEIETFLAEKAKQLHPYSRRFLSRDGDNAPSMNMEETLARIDALTGMAAFKAEMQRVKSYMAQLHEEKLDLRGREAFPFHYLVTTGGQGVGLSTALELTAALFYHLDIIDLGSCIEEKVNRCGGFFSDSLFDENGVCAIVDADYLDQEELEVVIEKMKGEYKNQVVALIVTGDRLEGVKRLDKVLVEEGVAYRRMHFPAFSPAEAMIIFRQMAAPLGLKVAAEEEARLSQLFALLEEKNRLQGVKTLRPLAGELAFSSTATAEEGRVGSSAEAKKTLGAMLEDMLLAEKDLPETQDTVDPMGQLHNLVGLHAVKERVREILGHFSLEKQKTELGVTGSELCMHMIFAGNPGTGKTTVARIIGRVLKNAGVLKKGDLIEVSRKDLVGRYVGWTAPLTEEVIKKSLGSVLFIDEAYALDGGHEHDFGHEVLASLVRMMEEHKEELVVIMAGYSEEMEKMIAMNPGLKSRVPHQINFPDYKGGELYDIFIKLLGPAYQVEEKAAAMLKELFNNAPGAAERQGGNGRFVRNIIDRLKMKQGKRLLGAAKPQKSELLQLTRSDVAALYEDEDIKNCLKRKEKAIGF